MLRNMRVVVGALAAVWLLFLMLQGESGFAGEVQTQKSQGEMEVSIIHVDKYGVYAPNLVFYWDTGMSKQRLAALTSMAERMRNKKATVVYSASGDVQKDKRPLLVDIFPAKERPVDKESVAGKEGQGPAPVKAKPAESPPVEVAAGGPAAPSRAPYREASEAEGAPGPQASLPQAPKAGGREPMPKSEAERPAPFEPKPATASSAASSMPITREEVTSFIKRLLELNEQKDLSSIMSCFADQVDYYDRGVVSKDYIRKDMGYYFRNWSSISSYLEGDVVLIVTDQHDVRVAKFVSAYSVSNARKSVSGRTENIWKIQRVNNELKIIDEKQRILSNERR